MKTKKIKGKHFIFDLYGCDYHELDNPALLEKLLTGAANAARMEILHTHFHKFTPQGVTGMLLLSTSHISVHTWPEYGYAAFDVFSCSDEIQTRRAVDYIIQNLTHSRKLLKGIDRGYAELKTITIPVYKTNTKKEIKVHTKLAEIKSPFQKIQVLDLDPYGKTLLIDGITQLSESDTQIYDKAITSLVRPTDKNILVLGGGDGFVAEEILKRNKKAQVTIAELDPEVVFCARTYFGKDVVFDDPRVSLWIGDALHYLKTAETAKKQFDGIIIDLTDNPVGSGKPLKKLEQFYGKLLKQAMSVLKEGGWISSQAGPVKAQAPYVTTYKVLRPLFMQYLGDVTEQKLFIPSFLEENVFLFGKRLK